MLEFRTKPSVQDGISKDVRVGETRHVQYAPGNGTRYDLLLVPCKGLGIAGTENGEGYTLVALLNGTCRSYPFMKETHWAYVGEKLGLREPDAQLIAELLEYLLKD